MKASKNKLIAPVVATLAIALTPAIAFAHGKLESAEPPVNGTVSTAPGVLRLTFNEDLEPTFSTIKVADASGASVGDEKAKVDPANKRVLTLAVPKLAAGTYSVQWAVMTGDSHKAKGTYKFSVN
ncbi:MULTISPECIES: copper resistance CopC family protein [Caballeronia]|uniref:Copper resistance protein CopC n=1 Tax=Caballeronia zhejiangensis TaxID=871203 RepID=A0A656QIZ7_9BURK|nr:MULTISPECIES: copper resistance protein CopC [Caballeronia]KDR28429.1 copper resistance protein CopC [Caballeronia zhejiangensis]MCE4547777.1 copper resistance protein CopC [Caballeronia sp. PC1]MCE4575669.1 copper resistance protein CopC [Caballeronia sp. CLC5]